MHGASLLLKRQFGCGYSQIEPIILPETSKCILKSLPIPGGYEGEEEKGNRSLSGCCCKCQN